MFLRIDRPQVEMEMPEQPDSNAASVVQELLGGRFGEMSTLNNYLFQSFNFKGKEKVNPYYQLIANIATEEFVHVELVTAAINGMLTGRVGGDGGGKEVRVEDGPPQGGEQADYKEEPGNFVPGYHPDELEEIAQRIMRNM